MDDTPDFGAFVDRQHRRELERLPRRWGAAALHGERA
jgi:hypothetical protein